MLHVKEVKVEGKVNTGYHSLLFMADHAERKSLQV